MTISDASISELVKLGIALLGFGGTCLGVLKVYIMWRRKLMAKGLVAEKNLNDDLIAKQKALDEAHQRAQEKLLERFERDLGRHDGSIKELGMRLTTFEKRIDETQNQLMDMMGKFIHSLRKQGMKTKVEPVGKGKVRVGEEPSGSDTG